jgi:hypothetical protein
MLTNFKKPSSVHSKQTKGGADKIGRGRKSGEKTEFEPSQLDTQSCCKQYISLVSPRTATMPLWLACSATSAEDTMITQNDAHDHLHECDSRYCINNSETPVKCQIFPGKNSTSPNSETF